MPLCKIVKSYLDYSDSFSVSQSSLLFSKYNHILKINVGVHSFFEISDLMSMDISTQYKNQLSHLKEGKHCPLFSLNDDYALYAIRLKAHEEKTVYSLVTQQNQLIEVNSRIEQVAGDLLLEKNKLLLEIEKNLNKMKR